MPCKCRDGLRRWHGQLHKLKESHIGGLEKFFASFCIFCGWDQFPNGFPSASLGDERAVLTTPGIG